MASQSPGYLPNAVYIAAQMTRKRMPADTIGAMRAAAQRVAAERARAGFGPDGAGAVRTRHQRPYMTKRTPVMYAFSLVTPANAKQAADASSHRARSVSRKR